MTNLENLLVALEKAGAPNNGYNVILTKTRLRLLLEIIRVQKEALDSIGLAKGLGSESSVFILRELSRTTSAKVQEIAGRK